MPVEITKLKRIEQIPLGVGSNHNWFYGASADAVATVLAAGFFNTVRHKLLVGDTIVYKAGLGTAPNLLFLNVATVPASPGDVTVTVDEITGGLTALADLTDASGGAAGAGIAAGVGIRQFSFSMNLADIGAGDLITALTPGYNGKILSFSAYVLKAATTAAKLATLTPKVAAANVTGGALALTSANMTPMGAKVAASAITAGNVFTSAQSIGVVASAVTPFVEGVGLFVLDLENTDEKNAFATLRADNNALKARLRSAGIILP